MAFGEALEFMFFFVGKEEKRVGWGVERL